MFYILKDRMFGCNLFTSKRYVKTMKNAMTIGPLPSLKRSHISFDYVGGTSSSLDNETVVMPTSFKVWLENGALTNLVDADDNTLYNKGSVTNATTWNHENHQLPPLLPGSIVKIQSEFDRNHGAIAVDNIRIHTQQRLDISSNK